VRPRAAGHARRRRVVAVRALGGGCGAARAAEVGKEVSKKGGARSSALSRTLTAAARTLIVVRVHAIARSRRAPTRAVSGAAADALRGERYGGGAGGVVRHKRTRRMSSLRAPLFWAVRVRSARSAGAPARAARSRSSVASAASTSASSSSAAVRAGRRRKPCAF
jgi:hypothetical protein